MQIKVLHYEETIIHVDLCGNIYPIYPPSYPHPTFKNEEEHRQSHSGPKYTTAISSGIEVLKKYSTRFEHIMTEIEHYAGHSKLYVIPRDFGGIAGKFFSPMETMGPVGIFPPLTRTGQSFKGWPAKLRGKPVVVLNPYNATTARIQINDSKWINYIGQNADYLSISAPLNKFPVPGAGSGWTLSPSRSTRWRNTDGSQSPLILLSHEMGHVWQWINWPRAYDNITVQDAFLEYTGVKKTSFTTEALRLEMHNIIYNEAPVAYQLGEGVRFHYQSGQVGSTDYLLKSNFPTTTPYAGLKVFNYKPRRNMEWPKDIGNRHPDNLNRCQVGDLALDIDVLEGGIQPLRAVANAPIGKTQLINRIQSNGHPAKFIAKLKDSDFFTRLKSTTETIVREVTGSTDFEAYDLKNNLHMRFHPVEYGLEYAKLKLPDQSTLKGPRHKDLSAAGFATTPAYGVRRAVYLYPNNLDFRMGRKRNGLPNKNKIVSTIVHEYMHSLAYDGSGLQKVVTYFGGQAYNVDEVVTDLLGYLIFSAMTAVSARPRNYQTGYLLVPGNSNCSRGGVTWLSLLFLLPLFDGLREHILRAYFFGFLYPGRVSLRAGTQKNLLVDRMRGNLVDTLKKTQQLANSKFVSAEDVPIKKMATVKNSKMSIDAGRRIRDLLAADVQPPFVTEILGCQRSSSH